MSARQRLDLLLTRLSTPLPLVRPGQPWLWPEGDPVMVDGDTHIRWLP